MTWRDELLELWRDGQRLGAVGPGPVTDQLAHSLALAAQLAAPEIAVDLGSGAGVPGLALAGVWPASRWLLLDAAARRARFLERAVARLGWIGRVTVVHGRAEDVARDPAWRGVADLVTARSFGPPAATVECGVGFLSPAGVLVVTEPPQPDPTRWPSEGLARLGLRAVASPTTDGVRIQRFEVVEPVEARYPRRPGIPEKRPLF